jgi:hypothetical protein
MGTVTAWASLKQKEVLFEISQRNASMIEIVELSTKSRTLQLALRLSLHYLYPYSITEYLPDVLQTKMSNRPFRNGSVNF